MNKSLDISWETLIAEHGAQLGIANTQTLQLPALEPGKDFQAVFRLSNGGGGTADPVFAGCNPSILFPTNPPPSWTFDEMEFANVDFGQRGRLVPNEHLDFECTVAGQLLTEERVAAIKKRDAILYLQIVVAFSDQFRNWAGFTQCARYDITTSTPRLYACSMHGPAENPQGTPRP